MTKCAAWLSATAFVIGFSASAKLARADVMMLAPSQDNTLIETTDGSRSNGAGPVMFAGRISQASNPRRRAVLSFNIASNIPAGAIIDDVSLTLHNSSNNTSPEPVAMHRLLADWGEGASSATGGSGAASTPGDATWLHTFYDTDLWNAAGGDFEPTLSSTTMVADPGYYTWSSTPELIDDVQLFLDDPSADFGWILIGNESAASTTKRFATREAPDAALRPVLTVTYTPAPGPIAGPALLAVALWTATRRRSHSL